MSTEIPWSESRMEFRPVTMTIIHEEKMRFQAINPEGVSIPIDAHRHLGGEGQIPNPIDYLIASLGGCVGIKILLSLSDHGITPDRLIIDVSATRKQTLPAIFDHVHLSVTLSGTIDNKLVSEILNQTMTHLCPIAAMFAEAGEVTYEYQITGK